MALFSALQKFITKNGQPVEGASVLVKLAGSATAATVYATRDGGAKSNPFLTGADGNALCYVSPGRYDMTVTKDAEQITFADVEVGPVSNVGTFAAGGVITDPDQLVEDAAGNKWRWLGALNYTYAPGEDPAEVVGWAKWVDGPGQLGAYKDEIAAGTADVKLKAGEVFGTSGAGSITVAPSGRVGIGENNPASLLAVKVENNATAGIRCRSEWTGSTALPYQNNDNCLFETYNNVESDSLNLSWSVSAPNGYNNIPAGVIDSGERFGVYGWAVSVNIPGYTHAGTLSTQYGIYGRAGFQGGGVSASPAGAVIQNAIAVRGQIRSDSPGATIVNARAGEFLCTGYESATVERNYGVYSQAENGTELNYSFFGAAGNFYNRDKSFFGTVSDTPFTESNAKASSRINNNSFEWGFPDAGYGCNLGSTPTTGFPFVAFCAEAESAGDNYRTRGRVGHVIQSSLLGELLFGILPTTTATNQALVEAFRITAGAGVSIVNRPTLQNGAVIQNIDVYADNAAAVSGGLAAGTLYRTSDGTVKVVF